MGTSKLREAVRALPAGATVCGWCAEFEDAARMAPGLALENDRLRRYNERLRVLNRRNSSEELERVQADLDYARRGWKHRRRDSAYEHPFCCPMCGWTPKDDAPHPLRSLRAHLRVKHGARSTRSPEGTA